MEIPQEVLSKLKNGLLLDKDQFGQMKDKEFKPQYDLMGLKYLREKAGKERDLRESYRGRAPYELLQNADDAKAQHAAYVLCDEGLAFVHDGKWFTTDNFRSLADGWSDKNPDECIGHKGLGFRSVLDISPSPYLVRIDKEGFFSVKFTWALNKGHFNETFKREPDTREEYERWIKHGQIVVPVMGIPGLANKQNLEQGAQIYDRALRGEYKHSFTTMFWLPAVDKEIEKTALEDLSPSSISAGSEGQTKLINFIADEVKLLLPFLKNIKSVSLYVNKDVAASVAKKQVEANSPETITIISNKEGVSKTTNFFQMTFQSTVPTEIAINSETPKAVKSMKSVSVTISVPLVDGEPKPLSDSHFHVYFPTKDSTGTGFIIHGDFYVKPDRTQLMSGKYNEWLIDFAAKKVANEYLTALIKRFGGGNVFKALAPNSKVSETGLIFRRKFSDALLSRKAPFLPHKEGIGTREQVILPYEVDEGGYLESEFSEQLESLSAQFFMYSDVDGVITRKFFDLAGVEILAQQKILDIIEAKAQKIVDPSWWYELFGFMAYDQNTESLPSESFEGRCLVLTTDNKVVKASHGQDSVICFPPAYKKEMSVPHCFDKNLVFLNQDLSFKVKRGDENTRDWLIEKLGITNFEANELIPKAIRSVVGELFSGEQPLSSDELLSIWLFVKDITDLTRTEISSDQFWEQLGRLPIPVKFDHGLEHISPQDLVPSFASYFPEEYCTNTCLHGVDSIRRIDVSFLEELAKLPGQSLDDWISFFRKTGVSDTPKQLTYVRFPKSKNLPFKMDGLSQLEGLAVSGDLQVDTNAIVVASLKREGFWGKFLNRQNLCEHESIKLLHRLTILEGFVDVCLVAEREYQSENSNWTKRLWDLIRGLPQEGITNNDHVHCPGGGKGGHNDRAYSYIDLEFEELNWLPSTSGPSSINECFARNSSQSRLISQGRSKENLSDILLPFVVTESYEDAITLRNYGVDFIEDADDAKSSALLRALIMLGDKLSSDWGNEFILKERSRWRLVRGAIQEIYRRLNQEDEEGQNLPFDEEIMLATRDLNAIQFKAPPFYYARPGSAIERAFLGKLPLIDVDRPLKRLFESLSVEQLVADDTVQEEFLAKDSCTPSPFLKEIIVKDLAPYLLAAVSDKGDKITERVVKRLEGRFDVLVADHLDVLVSLISNPEIEETISSKNFYLSKRAVQVQGAIDENHYILYVEGHNATEFEDLDADALGEILTEVFTDRVTEEVLGLFPRITSRFQKTLLSGNTGEMKDYLYRQLGIPFETQDTAVDILAGDCFTPEVELPPPPKAKEIPPQETNGEVGDGNVDSLLGGHQDDIKNKTKDLLGGLGTPSGGEEATPGEAAGSGENSGKGNGRGNGRAASKLSYEQKQRGVKGEEEIKRRLKFEGGWEGLRLIEDKRKDGCGYDFLCSKDDEEIKLEVKTFTSNGYISVTSRELQEASRFNDSYYLVGIEDNGKDENSWEAFIVRGPIGMLLSRGSFVIEARLQLDVASLLDSIE